MPFELVSLPFSSARPGPFAKSFLYKAGSDEREQVVKAVKRAEDNQCRIYILKNDATSCGFIAVSLSTLGDEELPMLVLDYIFVSQQFRGLAYEELAGLKIVDYLLAEVLRVAMEISRRAPVRFVGLEPANDELRNFYLRRDFKKLDKTDWLFTVLPKP